jgi:hypothetical protein
MLKHFYILHKRASLGQDFQVPEQSSVKNRPLNFQGKKTSLCNRFRIVHTYVHPSLHVKQASIYVCRYTKLPSNMHALLPKWHFFTISYNLGFTTSFYQSVPPLAPSNKNQLKRKNSLIQINSKRRRKRRIEWVVKRLLQNGRSKLGKISS